jgi:hypothetical protein
MYFPQIRGSNLNGRTFTLPRDFEGELNILFIAFHIWHQNDVNTWLPYTENLLRKYPNLQYYELPVVGSQNSADQSRIDGAMRSGIRDWSTRARTITLYVPRQEFCESLDLPDDRRIYTLLVTRDGQIMWAAEGPLTSEYVAADLEIAICALQPQLNAA